MDTFLTLVIALGGIATGIGAIWAAIVARRQAQVTERSLAKQVQSLREQNERTRLNLEVDLLFRMVDRFESPHFVSRRRSAARHIVDGSASVADDEVVEVERFDRAAFDVANFFEQLGYLQRLGALQSESVWHTFGRITQVYWSVYGSAIGKMREEQKDHAIYEEFERLERSITDLDRERGIEHFTRAELRRVMEDEAVLGEEPSASTAE